MGLGAWESATTFCDLDSLWNTSEVIPSPFWSWNFCCESVKSAVELISQSFYKMFYKIQLRLLVGNLPIANKTLYSLRLFVGYLQIVGLFLQDILTISRWPTNCLAYSETWYKTSLQIVGDLLFVGTFSTRYFYKMFYKRVCRSSTNSNNLSTVNIAIYYFLLYLWVVGVHAGVPREFV